MSPVSIANHFARSQTRKARRASPLEQARSIGPGAGRIAPHGTPLRLGLRAARPSRMEDDRYPPLSRLGAFEEQIER